MTDKTINDVYQQLASIVNSTYSEIGAELLVSTKYGVVVYNKYLIRKNNWDFEVVSRTGSETLMFGSAKNALIWAILDHHTKISESKRVRELDGLIHGVGIDCRIHTNLKNKGTVEGYLIYSSKLQHDQQRQKQFLYEIDKYIKLAQKCQQTRTNQ
jgi:hypothetical protein